MDLRTGASAAANLSVRAADAQEENPEAVRLT
jgi:hypothetical protein